MKLQETFTYGVVYNFLKWLVPMFYMGSRLEASHMASCMSSTSGDMGHAATCVDYSCIV